jgi:carboxypeptidase Taq
MTLFSNPVVLDLLAKYKPIAAMTHTSALLGWDLEINMPEAGAGARGQAQAEIELLRQKMTIGLTDLIEKAEKQKTLNDAEKGIVRVIKRELDFYQKIPSDLLEQLQRATVEASVPWREARKKADFRIFQPHLEKITELKRKQAEHLNPSTHPYNALLDLFEEGMTINDLDRIFSTLIPQLKKILAKTLAQGRFPMKHPLEDVDYDVQAFPHILSQQELPVTTSESRRDTSPKTSRRQCSV